LKIKPCADNYHFTENFLSLAKDFVTKQITQEYEVSKADQIDLLNRSVNYFKDNERFVQADFSQQVFGDHEGLITSFKDFQKQAETEYEIELKDGFDISDQAVKNRPAFLKCVKIGQKFSYLYSW
jgi:hypothetical protein